MWISHISQNSSHNIIVKRAAKCNYNFKKKQLSKSPQDIVDFMNYPNSWHPRHYGTEVSDIMIS